MSTLKRTTPLGRRPKGKGNMGELEVVKLLQRSGWPSARRNFASGGQGGSDIVNGPTDVAIEVKRQETCRIWSWIEQCEEAAAPTEMPLVAFRRNRSRWYACVPFEDLLGLLHPNRSPSS